MPKPAGMKVPLFGAGRVKLQTGNSITVGGPLHPKKRLILRVFGHFY